MSVLEFKSPHTTGKLQCVECGAVAVHVWPSQLRMEQLECHGCNKVGPLRVAIPLAAPPVGDQGVRPERTAAQKAVDALRDAAREGRVIHFRERDELVMTIHDALAASQGGETPLRELVEELRVLEAEAEADKPLQTAWVAHVARTALAALLTPPGGAQTIGVDANIG